ncbi:oligoendopeptidase F [Fictibacillus enclensis]|uniref:Oligopeptidase F n=1 Tax=Fictibacillus enclensis TaxID=1017270 RepID=A0A0V8JCW4_9BACL|nr:oligoendopeptidase F [Fictibacillus enclensis]KSU84862.1 oligopeptidase PepB [Fictibacillus enclensis]SCB87002.1 oligoendopeptidase F [Fictibacillus enclensis]
MAQTKSKSLPKREELPLQDTWDLEAIYATNDKWEEEFSEVKRLLPEVKQFQGKLGESADTLFQFFQKQDELTKKLGKLYTYAHMRYDQDTTNSLYQGLNDRASNLATQVGSSLSFAVPEILLLPEETIDSYIKDNKDLGLYKHVLDEINRQRPHVLSKEEEALLADVSEVTASPSTTFGMLNNADLKFPVIKDENGEEIEVTHGRYIRFLESSDRRVREDAFKAVYGTYDKFKNTFASTLAGTVKKDNFFARTRKFDSARQAALNDNNIPEEVYENLVKTVNDHLHLLHRYVDIRKRALNLDELHMYDLYTPLVQDVKMEVTYEEAKKLVLESLDPMGEEYKNIVKEGFEKRWIDVHENAGKRSGAYSSGAYGTMPYILLNWQDNVNNLFTLTHEVGHSVHSYYTRESQPYPYADYSIFVAEVASTCNEALLNHYMLNKTKDKQEKLYLLNHHLEGFRGTVFRQTMFAEFEQAIHVRAANGEPLTPELLTQIYYDLNVKYFGENVVIDKEIGLEWSRIPHFYYNFYVYQYSTGFSAAASLSKQILEEGESSVSRYIDFLKAGSSDYPIEVLKKAGVDMTTSKPVEDALKVFEEILDEMESLLFEQ